MEFTEEQQTKLDQAKEILQELGLPPVQYNDHSPLVFLALANVKPDEAWEVATAPLLPTYVITDFIRNHYGKDYKPNSREMIRRQTLHQFEQARIIDHYQGDPTRPTNSKNNNYSLNQPIIDILKAYHNGDWKQQIEVFKQAVTSHGPVSPKRWIELDQSFRNYKVGLVYVTAFPDRAEFRKMRLI
ncbi:hypothetical protein NBRC116591_11180 [Sessilibacter corallicola]|uniref:BsuBI/PstI restriction endonuclease HTH domain-containing protein n=1 Tax=Sessilibacter corallicola TaxID=2904075 RepID=A0ABQ0A6M0_9GAMM